MMDRSNLNWKFTNNHLVVITSNTAISMFSWKYYLQNNWYDIMMKENTRLLILGGIHGKEDGTLGPTDKTIEDQTLFHIKKLKEEKEDDIKDFNIAINYECVGDFLDKDTWQPKPEELVQAIVKHQPTVLLLAFCYTSQSILNETLKSQGIYSLLIMQAERENITQGRCIFLDEEQKKALLTIAQKRPNLVMLQGNFGTGKTLLLMEALRIKIAQYQQENQRIRVIVTCDTKQEALLTFLRCNYQFNDVNIEFHDCLKDVKVNDELGILGQVISINDLNSIVRRLGNAQYRHDNSIMQKFNYYYRKYINTEKYGKYCKTILVIDEFFIKGKQDWNLFQPHENIDVLLAFHPRKEVRFPFILPPQEEQGFFHCRLGTMYRNSYEVLRLCSFVSSHASHFTESSTAKIYPLLSPEEIEHTRDLLPPGNVPIWIELKEENFHPVNVFTYIKIKYLKNVSSVSFIISDSHSHSEDVKLWLKENGFHQYSTSEFAQVASSFKHSMRGLEDEIIVIMPNTLKDHGLFLEAMTRARKTFICVTTAQSSFRPILATAANHHLAPRCSDDQQGTSCPFLWSTVLLAKDKCQEEDLLLLEMESIYNNTAEQSPERLEKHLFFVEPLLNGSSKRCKIYLENNGLKILILLMGANMSGDIRCLLVKILGHLASVPQKREMLRREDILKYLMTFNNPQSVKDTKISLRAGLLYGVLCPDNDGHNLSRVRKDLNVAQSDIFAWAESIIKKSNQEEATMENMIHAIWILKTVPHEALDEFLHGTWNRLELYTRESEENCAEFVQHGGVNLLIQCAESFCEFMKDWHVDILLVLQNIVVIPSLKKSVRQEKIISMLVKVLRINIGRNSLNWIGKYVALRILALIAHGDNGSFKLIMERQDQETVLRLFTKSVDEFISTDEEYLTFDFRSYFAILRSRCFFLLSYIPFFKACVPWEILYFVIWDISKMTQIKGVDYFDSEWRKILNDLRWIRLQLKERQDANDRKSEETKKKIFNFISIAEGNIKRHL